MKTIDQKTFSLVLPDGWEVLSESENETLVYKGTQITDYLSNPSLNISIKDSDGMSLDEVLQLMIEQMGATAASDITIEGSAYKAFTVSEGGEDSVGLLYNKSADGKDAGNNFALIFFIHTTQENQEALNIISSIVFK